MSFLSQISDFKKSSLRKSETNVTTCDGRQYVEQLKTETGEYASTTCSPKSHGWIVDWKPDLQVAKICDHVFLGSQDVAQDIELLLQHNITHIVNAACGLSNLFPEKFHYCNLDLLDLPETIIFPSLDKSNQFIDCARSSCGNVLIHCNAGISRAPTVAIAYLVKSQKISLHAAFSIVKSARSSISPNRGFMQQLHEYEKMIVKIEQ